MSEYQVALEARGVSFAYVPGENIIDTWSASFEQGSLTAVMGPSGRGKSTALFLLGLMLRPTAGSIFVGGEPASSQRDSSRARVRARQFGFVFQDAALDPTRSVIDNVCEVSLYNRGDRAWASRRAAGLLEEFAVSVPMRRRPGQISGGQAQRIALCRALLSEPPIILADEPTGNLDAESSRLVVNALTAYAASGRTVVVVTHSEEVARECDRVIRL